MATKRKKKAPAKKRAAPKARKKAPKTVKRYRVRDGYGDDTL